MHKLQTVRPTSAVAYRPGPGYDVPGPITSSSQRPRKDMQSESAPNLRLHSSYGYSSSQQNGNINNAGNLYRGDADPNPALPRTTYIPSPSLLGTRVEPPRPISAGGGGAIGGVTTTTTNNTSKFSILRSIPTHVSATDKMTSGEKYNAMNKSAINRVAAYIQHNIIEELENGVGIGAGTRR